MKKTFSSFCLITFITLVANTQVPADSLTGYWQFNGNTFDHSGNKNHGTIYGDAELTTDRFDTTDAACSFDKTDDCIRIDNTPDLDI